MNALSKWLDYRLKDWHGAPKNSIKFFLNDVIDVEKFTIAEIGQYAASQTDILPRHGAKRAYRLIHNNHLTEEKMIETTGSNLLQYVENCKQVILAIDWTTFNEKFMVCSICLTTAYHRGVPLVSLAYEKGNLGELESQNKFEEELVTKIIFQIPEEKEIIILADRGFDRAYMPNFIGSFRNVHYIIRVKMEKYILAVTPIFSKYKNSIKSSL